MFSKRIFYSLVFIISVLICGASFNSTQAALNLNGRILLQVQDKGQAWYVNPINAKRYYLGRPEDAFNLMRSLGLGISNVDLAAFKLQAPARLAGRILLQVQDKGQAYYVEPRQLKLYYLGRSTDAFNLMRAQGLGITNADLNKIPTAVLTNNPVSAANPNLSAISPVNQTTTRFAFKYQNVYREMFLPLSADWYRAYASAPKIYSYFVGSAPADLREAFYGLFLKLKTGDTSLEEIINQARAVARQNNWTEDQTVEFILALIQYIPYDSAKVVSDLNPNPYYPYETLYLDKGVCSDKTFLAVVILRRLGYGAAILDFPDINHTAVGISCPPEMSLNNSGYCYVETTNYFPFSVIPQSINGQATATNEFAELFNPAGLGKIKIKQSTTGKVYQGAAGVRAQVDNLQTLKTDLKNRQTEMDTLQAALSERENNLSTMRAQMDTYYNNGQTADYNALVPTYNNLADQYNADLGVYRNKVNEYNLEAVQLNQAVRDFYQQ